MVRISQQALDAGKCVVIGLQSTGEAGAKEDESGCSAASSILKNFIERWAPLDDELKEALLERCDKMNLPINPLVRPALMRAKATIAIRRWGCAAAC